MTRFQIYRKLSLVCLQQLMSVRKIRFVKLAFQIRLADEHLKTNLLAGCSNSKVNFDDSEKNKRQFHKSQQLFFLHGLRDSDMCALPSTIFLLNTLLIFITCVFTVLYNTVMRPTLVFLSVICSTGDPW